MELQFKLSFIVNVFLDPKPLKSNVIPVLMVSQLSQRDSLHFWMP